MAIIEQEVDPITKLPLRRKNLTESKRFIFNAKGDLISGDTIASVISITAEAQEGLDTGSTLTIGTALISTDGIKIVFFISGGVIGERYIIKALVITAANETIQLEGVLIIEA